MKSCIIDISDMQYGKKCMVKVMSDSQNVLKASCNNIELLFPLTSIRMILSKEYIEMMFIHEDEIEYEHETYNVVSMAELLACKDKIEEDYVLLLQDKQQRIALTIPYIDGVICVGKNMYKLPTYLPAQTYITDCHVLEDGTLAYQIDVSELMKKNKRI